MCSILGLVKITRFLVLERSTDFLSNIFYVRILCIFDGGAFFKKSFSMFLHANNIADRVNLFLGSINKCRRAITKLVIKLIFLSVLLHTYLVRLILSFSLSVLWHRAIN